MVKKRKPNPRALTFNFLNFKIEKSELVICPIFQSSNF